MLSDFFIFLGETHGFLDDFLKIKELIVNYSPEYILFEQLQDISLIEENDFKVFLDKKKSYSSLVDLNDVFPLVKLCQENSIPLIGIDFYNYGYSDKLLELIQKQSDELSEEELNKFLLKRTQHHITKINEYKKNSNKLLIILGAWHLRKESLLREIFKEATFILPMDEDNNEVLEPGEKKLHFGVVNKNGTLG